MPRIEHELPGSASHSLCPTSRMVPRGSLCLGNTPDVGFVLHRPAQAGKAGVSLVDKDLFGQAYPYGRRTLQLLVEKYPARPNSSMAPAATSLGGLHHCHRLGCLTCGRIDESATPSVERLHRAIAD